MGLMVSKMYIDSYDPPVKIVKGISVYYGAKEHILYSNLVLSEGIEIHATENDIDLSYPADDKVLFSLKDNIVHFIVINSLEPYNKEGLIKTESVKYPWRSEYCGIQISRISEEEYKESWLHRSVFFTG